MLEVVRPGQPGRDVHEPSSPTFSASSTRESGRSGCTSALVVVLPAPWVPLSHTIPSPDATLNGLSTEEHQDPHRPQLGELCIDTWMTESLTTSCGLSNVAVGWALRVQYVAVMMSW